jgi:hypothetical protein
MSSVYVELHSGFGNQIFQYALALALKEQGFNSHILPSRGNTHSQKNYQTLFRLIPHSTDREVPSNAVSVNKKSGAFDWWDLKELAAFNTVKLSGYYQNYRLFKGVIPKLAAELCNTFQTMYGSTTWNPESTAFVHVRRDDYLLPHAKMYNLQMNYYDEAIDRIQCINPGIKFVVVSDDMAWCKAQKWPTIYPVEFFDSSDELKTFWCFLNCKAAAIIANSTFSYWGALLSAHQIGSPIVYPKAWHLEVTPELFPDTWMGVGSKENSLKIRC